MGKISKIAFRCAIVLVTWPVAFFGIILGWHWIDQAIAYREVSTFIQQHQQFTDKWRGNPAVHSLSLSHDPEFTGNLLIQFDVDDKRTYERLESALAPDTVKLRFPPRWKTKLRSNEELGNDWGAAVAGMGLAAEELKRLLIAACVASLVAGLCAWFLFGKPRTNVEPTTD